MPSICGRYSGQGILVPIVVTPTGQIQASNAPRQLTLTPYQALVDTGASGTCISPKVIDSLGLKPVGKVEMQAAGGTCSTNQYLIDLLMTFGDQFIHFSDLKVVHFAVSENSPFQALLGMDVITRGCFTLSFDGHFTLSI